MNQDANNTLRGIEGFLVACHSFEESSVITDQKRLRESNIGVFTTRDAVHGLGWQSLIVAFHARPGNDSFRGAFSYLLQIEVSQEAQLTRDDEITAYVPTWRAASHGVVAQNMTDDCLHAVDQLTQQLVDAYRSVNPRDQCAPPVISRPFRRVGGSPLFLQPSQRQHFLQRRHVVGLLCSRLIPA